MDEISVSVVEDTVGEDQLDLGETQPRVNTVPGSTLKANPLTITTTALPPAQGAATYSTQLQAEGGAGPKTWSVAPGTSLPPGLNLSSSGEISGTPLVGGSFMLTARVTDLSGLTEQLYSLDISQPPDLTVSAIDLSPQAPDSSDAISFSVTLQNLGEEPSAA